MDGEWNQAGENPTSYDETPSASSQSADVKNSFVINKDSNGSISGSVNIVGSKFEENSKNNFLCGEVHQHFYTYNNQINYQYHKTDSARKGTEKLSTKLKDALKRAAESCNKIASPIPGTEINFVPLQITTDIEKRVQGWDNFGDFTKRSDFLKAFDLPKGNVGLRKLFTMAERRGHSKEGKHCCSNQFCCNAIGVIGQAGIGKTTICKHLITAVLQDASWNFEFVFNISIRDTTNEEKYDNLLQFLVIPSFSEWNSSKEEDDALLQMLSKSHKVLIGLDGLDEAVLGQAETRGPSMSMYKAGKAEFFIKNILMGKLFPHATKFVTSRPRQFFHMHPDCRPHFIACVIGLCNESKDRLCQQICKDNSSKVKEFLNRHPNVSAYCYVPATCILTMYALLMIVVGQGGEANCGTITSIMLHTLEELVISSHVRSISQGFEQELMKLANLAMDAFSKGQITFRESDFRQYNIDKEMVYAFLQTHADSKVRMKIIDGKKISYFLHLTWQEFFAAIHTILFTDDPTFSATQSKFVDSKWEVVVKFVFGLTNVNNIQCLQSLFDGNFSYSRLLPKLEVLKEFVSESMAGIFSSDPSEITFVQVCTWINEAKREEYRKIVVDNLPSELVLLGDLLPSDVTSLHYVLRGCSKPCRLKVLSSSLCSR